MSIKKIIAIVALVLVVYAGGYVCAFSVKNYLKFALGAERTIDYMSPSEIQSLQRVNGTIDNRYKIVIGVGDAEDVTPTLLGFPIGKHRERQDFLLLLNPDAKDEDNYRYCIIASSDEEIIQKLRNMQHGGEESFEFKGIVQEMPLNKHDMLTEYLGDYFSDDFDIYMRPNVQHHIVPCTILITDESSDEWILPIIIGGAAALAGTAVIIIIAVKAYRDKHRY